MKKCIAATILLMASNGAFSATCDLKCLSDETYYSLVSRDRALRNYATELRALLEAK